MTVITSDNVGAGRLAIEHLVGLGHRRIAYLRGPGVSPPPCPGSTDFGAPVPTAGLDPAETPMVGGEADSRVGTGAPVNCLPGTDVTAIYATTT